ncbi:hypothetical protein Kisp01_66160 [Kineosporia sp. NBRC 101677]|nr:hypothetical protein Kisp01_66160 [Kineosporia sp. NBRC 101677]
MTPHLFALSFDAREPQRLTRFWAQFLGHEMVEEPRRRSNACGWGGRGEPGVGPGVTLAGPV